MPAFPGRASRARPGSASSSSSPSPPPSASSSSSVRNLPGRPASRPASSSSSVRNLQALAWERGHLARIFVFVLPTHRPHHLPIHSETSQAARLIRRVPRAGHVAACSSRRIKRACLKTVHRETLGVVAVVRTRQGKKSGRGAWWGAYPCARIRATPPLPPIPALRCALARTPPLPAIPTAFSVVLSCQPWENGPTD